MDRDSASSQLMDYKAQQKSIPGKITMGSGDPVGTRDAILTVGPYGPALMQDQYYFDAIGHFALERTPERVVAAKGSGAFGYFEVTGNITKYCAARLFDRVKKRTPIAVRFSTFSSEKGSPDSARDIRGFAVKFYTEDGIWDIVGSNLPVFFIRDPALFPSLVHSQRRNPQTNLKDADMFWDFITLRPETMHAVCLLFSDRGIPETYRYMHGYGMHTYKMVNLKGEPIYCKFHFRCNQDILNMDPKTSMEMHYDDPDCCTRDLYNAIQTGNYPSWTMAVQLMTFDEAKKNKFNPFDVTKTWCKKEFPLITVGKLILDRNPVNYFAEIEQLAFNPANMIPGIEASSDKMLQGRLVGYNTSQFHRLGKNYAQIPVNCPYRVKVSNYNRDGPMTVNCNQGKAPNYFPNSFAGPEECARAKALQACCPVNGEVYRFKSGDTEDNFSQASIFWGEVLDEEGRCRLVENISRHLVDAAPFIQENAIRNFSLIHADFGRLITEGLIAAKEAKMKMPEEEGEGE